MIRTHDELVTEQFAQQAQLFANAPVLHAAAALDPLVQAAKPQPTDMILDVACGPGTVVAAFAPHVAHAAGLDATDAMIRQARTLAARQSLDHVSWYVGDVYALPFDDGAFDIVTCRFAFHHFENPAAALREMLRVCKSGGRVVVCDAVVSDDPAKAAAFNAMQRLRDPSTVAFRTSAYFVQTFADAGLPVPTITRYQLPVEMEALLATSFPLDDNRDAVRALLRAAVPDDAIGARVRDADGQIHFEYAVAIFAAMNC